MIDRILRAIRLDPNVYREIAEDENAMSEAAIIVIVVTFLSALGSAFVADNFIVGLLVGWLTAIVVGWILWAVLTYFVGANLFGGRSSIPEMLRVLGYASAPQLLGVLGFIPCLGWLAALIGAILSLIAGVIAVRESMEFDTGKAVLTVLIAWLIAMAIRFGITLLVGGGAAALGALG
ncbi:MAG TPA: YIP1 family protein [Anaerolineae bacterium]|nr:YIP1 family protein [Anaerolineae bacterium]